MIQKTSKIVIVANGKSVMKNNYGSIINKFPNVGRINNYKIDGYENQIGNKTNIWFNGANERLKIKNVSYNKTIIFIPSVLQKKKEINTSKIEKRIGITNKKDYSIISLNEIKKYEKLCGCSRLTTGTYSILWSINNFSEVFIYGFDFFIDSKSHYFDNVLLSTLKEKNIFKLDPKRLARMGLYDDREKEMK